MATQRKVRIVLNQVVAVPLADGTFGAAHVVAAGPFPVFALYERRSPAPSDLVNGWDVSRDIPLAIASMPGWVADGTWPVVAEQTRDYSQYSLPEIPPKFSFSSHFASAFLDAYHGLAPWDGMHDPTYFEKHMLPGTPVPPNLRFKMDFPVK